MDAFTRTEMWLSNCLLHVVVRTKTIIIQKFLEKGYTWMKVDSVHSTRSDLLARRLQWSDQFSKTAKSLHGEKPALQLLLGFLQNCVLQKHLHWWTPGGGHPRPSVFSRWCDTVEAPSLWHLDSTSSQTQQVITFQQHTDVKQPRPTKKTKWEHLQQLKGVMPSVTNLSMTESGLKEHAFTSTLQFNFAITCSDNFSCELLLFVLLVSSVHWWC